MAEYVYVGVPQWTATASAGLLGGLFRQEIGAVEWRHLTTGFPDKVEVRTIAIHPRDPRIIYVGTQHGPYRSSDGGEHWERLAFPEQGGVVWTIVFHPHDPQILYLGTAPPAIYRSDNGGESWRQLPIVATAGAVRMAFPMRVIRLVTDPSNPRHIYAALEVGGVIRSLDGGETWNDCTPALLTLADRPHLRSQIVRKGSIHGFQVWPRRRSISARIQTLAQRQSSSRLARRRGTARSGHKGRIRTPSSLAPNSARRWLDVYSLAERVRRAWRHADTTSHLP
jgi:photosystem II stability/assembly factor-like uncharacterized protein